MGMACKTNGEEKAVYRILVGKPEEATRNTDVCRRIILKWILG
jgi:hypothetical protein